MAAGKLGLREKPAFRFAQPRAPTPATTPTALHRAPRGGPSHSPARYPPAMAAWPWPVHTNLEPKPGYLIHNKVRNSPLRGGMSRKKACPKKRQRCYFGQCGPTQTHPSTPPRQTPPKEGIPNAPRAQSSPTHAPTLSKVGGGPLWATHIVGFCPFRRECF